MNPIDKKTGLWQRFTSLQELASILPVLVLFIIISIVNPHFISGTNLANMGKLLSIWGMLAIGECFIMMVGEIDISISAMCCWCGMFFAWLMVNIGLPWYAALIFTILMGFICSMINGLCIVKLKLPAFVVSIGMTYVFKGFAKFITQSMPINIKLAESGAQFAKFGTARIMGNAGWALPITIAAFVIAWLILHKTAYGRKITATGDSLIAARISGVDTDKIKLSVFAISGVLVGIVSALMVGRDTTANPASCAGWEMNCIAACAIGGTSMDGGSGSIIGLFFGVVFMAGVLNALNLLSINSNYQNIIIGLSIMISVTADIMRRQKKLGTKVR